MVLYGNLNNLSAIIIMLASGLVVLFSAAAGIISFINLGSVTLRKTLPLFILDVAVFSIAYDACATATGNGEIRSPLGTSFANMDPYVRALILALMLAFSAYRMIRYMYEIRHEITTYSVSEAMDAMPQGILFATEDGQILQSNSVIEDLAYRLTGEVMMDGREFWDRVEAGQVQEGIQVEKRGGSLVTEFPEGDTWILSNSVRECDITPFRQLIAVDATEEVRITRELDLENKRLSDMNRRLRNYNNVVDRAVREEELLATKKRVHDNMGSALLAAKALIANDDSPLKPEDVLLQWEEDMALMKNDESVKRDKTQLQRLKDAADFLGIDLQLMGEIPENYGVMNLICTGIQECMTNAVQHAQATQMYVVILRESEEYTVSYSNNGKPMDGELKEGVGLTLLRETAEKMGATMEYAEGRFFNLTLHIPRPISE